MSNSNQWAEQMAAMFAAANVEAAKNALQARATTTELEEAREELRAAEAKHAANLEEYKEVIERFDTLAAAGWPGSVKGCFGGAGILAFGFFISLCAGGHPVLTVLLLLIGGLLGLFGFSDLENWKRLAGALARERDEVRARVKHSAETGIAITTRGQQIATTLANLDLKSRVMTLGQVWLPLRVVQVGGYSALVDESGCVPATTIALPELQASDDVLGNVERAVKAAERRPVLLSASVDNGRPTTPGILHGEELQLADAMREFSRMVDGAQVHQSEVRLVAREDAVATMARKVGATENRKGPILRAGGDAKSAAANISAVLGRSRAAGTNTRDRLARAASDLQRATNSLGALRTRAVQSVHAAVAAVVERSHYVHTVVYCPKCNQVPAYLFHRVGLEESTVHELSPVEILDRIDRDPESSARVEREPELLDELAQVILKLQELRAIATSTERIFEEKRQSGTVVITELRALEATLRAQRSECDKHALQLRGCVRRIVTGSIRPLTELSRQASLMLNPDTHHWSCASCATTFEDPAIVRMGEVLRIRDELMSPMWNHLWTEKADFCRSELFRSNEQVANLIERETGAMRDVAEQYRADMRPVRENLILSVTNALAGRERLHATQQSLVALGVSSREAVEKNMEAVDEMFGGDLNAMRARVEAKETILVQLPATLIGTRPTLRDPIEQHKDATEIFHRRLTVETPRLASDTAGEG